MVQANRNTTHKNAVSKDESGVSAVIGVILMIAVTVILAAVIGAFVFNYAPNLLPSQGAQPFAFVEHPSDATLTIINNGGVGATDIIVKANGYLTPAIVGDADATDADAWTNLNTVGGQVTIGSKTTAPMEKGMLVTVTGIINGSGNRVVLATHTINDGPTPTP